jgi:prepilin-type N-terminal cleavage/methylation domain-containing protein
LAPGGEDGYTALELIVVIIVLGIVATAALAILSGQRGHARDATAKVTVSQMARSIEQCRLQSDSYRTCDNRAMLDDFSARWGQRPGEVGVVMELTDDDSFAAYAVSRHPIRRGKRIYAWIKNREGVTRTVCDGPSPAALASTGCRRSTW